MSNVIKLTARNQRLSIFSMPHIASGAFNYVKIQMSFITDDWKTVEIKTANFSWRGYNYPVVLDENNQCYVPKEVIKAPEFKVSIFGGGITTNFVRIPVEKSCVGTEDYPMVDPTSYTDLINKISAVMDKFNETKADNIIYNENDNSMQLMANGQPIGDSVVLQGGECGVVNCYVNENGHLITTLSDGREIDAGKVAGDNGVTFTPSISEDFVLSWTNDGGVSNPPSVDLYPNDNWHGMNEGNESDYEWESMA